MDGVRWSEFKIEAADESVRDSYVFGESFGIEGEIRAPAVKFA